MSTISPEARDVRLCPFCNELIGKSAIRCPHCNQNLFIPKPRRKRPFYLSDFMLGFYTACMLWIIVVYIYFFG